MQKICITQAKKTRRSAWLGKVSNIPLQQSIADLGVAFKNFFDSCSGERKGQKIKPPRFKKKTNQQSARFRKGGFSLKNESVGIDLGLKTFAALSTGQNVSSPDYSKLDRKTRRAQRKFSRREKGSKRRERMRLKVAKLKAKERDTRKDFLHKLFSKVVSENQVIVLEDLNVSGMLKNRCLSRSISKAGWREFRTMCDAKSNKFGREFVVISRWEPNSQICSDCGYRWGKLDLSIREILCINCGTHHDRDSNASRNIEKVGAGARTYPRLLIGHGGKRQCDSFL